MSRHKFLVSVADQANMVQHFGVCRDSIPCQYRAHHSLVLGE
jgi:hypothetical protein